MFRDKRNPSSPSGDETIPSRQVAAARKPPAAADLIGPGLPATFPPLLLKLFLDGAIDLDEELSRRFPTPPLLSTVHLHAVSGQAGLASLAAQDGAAILLVEADSASRAASFVFLHGSMLALRFTFDQLSDADRSRWLEHVQREEGGLVFLWGQSRWEQDYIITSARRYFVTLYAFSPRGVEAAVRCTPEVMRHLVQWLSSYWAPPTYARQPADDLTTW
ncbi:MAG: hypothetical protein ACUVSX_11815 [Aggregatilineales bacterium]